MKKADTYKEVKTFDFPGIVVRVHIPDLTQEEREARLKAIGKGAANFLKAVRS